MTGQRAGSPAATDPASKEQPVMTTTSTDLHPADVLVEQLNGAVIAPTHPSYDDARQVWNGMIDRRPTAMVRCADAEDVATAIRLAAERDLPLRSQRRRHRRGGRRHRRRPVPDARGAGRPVEAHCARAGWRDLGRRG